MCSSCRRDGHGTDLEPGRTFFATSGGASRGTDQFQTSEILVALMFQLT